MPWLRTANPPPPAGAEATSTPAVGPPAPAARGQPIRPVPPATCGHWAQRLGTIRAAPHTIAAEGSAEAPLPRRCLRGGPFAPEVVSPRGGRPPPGLEKAVAPGGPGTRPPAAVAPPRPAPHFPACHPPGRRAGRQTRGSRAALLRPRPRRGPPTRAGTRRPWRGPPSRGGARRVPEGSKAHPR